MNQIIGGTTIRLHQDDNVVVAAQNIGAGATIPGEGVVTASPVPSGHKIATRAIAAGDYVRKYNQIIGVATADIAPGDACPRAELRHERVRARLRLLRR